MVWPPLLAQPAKESRCTAAFHLAASPASAPQAADDLLSFLPTAHLPSPSPGPTPCPCSALFWQPTSIALGLFTMPDGQVPLVHFSSTPLDLILNAPNYTGGAVWASCPARCRQSGTCCWVPPAMMD